MKKPVVLKDVARSAGISDADALAVLFYLYLRCLIELRVLVFHDTHPEDLIATKPIAEGLNTGTWCDVCCQWIGNEHLTFDFSPNLKVKQ